MTKSFVDYLAGELPWLSDFKPLNQTDPWPAAFRRDQDYLRGAIASLEKEVERVHETVRSRVPKRERTTPHRERCS